MQSVPITTKVMSSNPAHGEVYTLCDKVCQWFVTGRWFFPGTPVSATNKTDRHDITEIVLSDVKHNKPNPIKKGKYMIETPSINLKKKPLKLWFLFFIWKYQWHLLWTQAHEVHP